MTVLNSWTLVQAVLLLVLGLVAIRPLLSAGKQSAELLNPSRCAIFDAFVGAPLRENPVGA